MNVLVGVVLILLAILLISGIVMDMRNHGTMYLQPRVGGPMPLGMQIFAFVLIGCFLLGGLYLLLPQAAGICGRIP